jgi:glycosyltransferase involved in cell wall biosynthesis
MALLEGMAAGLACVTTPVGGIPELIHDGENGLLVPVADPPALAQALERLIDDASLRAALGRHARFSVEPLSVTEYSRKLGQVYDAVLHPDSRLAAPRSS